MLASASTTSSAGTNHLGRPVAASYASVRRIRPVVSPPETSSTGPARSIRMIRSPVGAYAVVQSSSPPGNRIAVSVRDASLSRRTT